MLGQETPIARQAAKVEQHLASMDVAPRRILIVLSLPLTFVRLIKRVPPCRTANSAQ